jgi:tetratricopeptide (TPR) repeat protein
MERSELTLEYWKILIWPILVIVIALVFRTPITSVFMSGDIELNVLGVTLKGSKSNMKQIDDLKRKELMLQKDLKKTAQDIDSLHAENKRLYTENLEIKSRLDNLLLEQQKSGQNVEAARKLLAQEKDRAKKDAEESNRVYQDAKQRITQSQKLVSKPRVKIAKKFETAGFENLINDRFDESLEDFEKAYEAYPEYHNVEEISKLLRKNIKGLNDISRREQTQIDVYRPILEKYSWEIPDDIKQEMHRSLILNDPEYIRSQFKSPEREKTSDMMAEFAGKELTAIVDSLILAILPSSDHRSYRVNIYISRTLALIQPNWYGTKDQYQKLFNMKQTENYQDKIFKKWADQAIENFRVLAITLETIRLEKAGDIGGGGHIFFELKNDDQSLVDLAGFPTRKKPLKISNRNTYNLDNLTVHIPVFSNQDFWPVKLFIRVWDHDRSKFRDELTASFAPLIDEDQIGQKIKLTSINQDTKFPEKNGELTLSIR